MQILLENGYFTGMYVIGGVASPNENQTVLIADVLPDEQDNIKQKAYKWDYTNLVWVYDADRYSELLAEQELLWQPTGWEPNTHQAKIEYLAMMASLDISSTDYLIDEFTNIKFKKTRSYYKYGHWSLLMTANAVVKGWITPDEYETITGLDYVSA